MRLKMTFLWVFICSLGLTAATGVYALFAPQGSMSGEILATTALMGAYGFVTLMAAIVLERRRFVPLMWFDIAAASVCALCMLVVIWTRFSSDQDLIARTAIVSAILAAWSTHLGLICLPALRRGVGRAARALTAACAGLLALILIAFTVNSDMASWFEQSTLFQSLTGSLAVVACAGSIAIPVLRRLESLQRTGDEDHALAARPEIFLTCPRCGAAQTVRAGKSRCAQCRLGFTIEVEEPRCPCGYLLYGVPGDKCPECGAPIAAEKRWAPPTAAPTTRATV